MAEICGGREDCGGAGGWCGWGGYARHPSALDIKPLRVAEPM